MPASSEFDAIYAKRDDLCKQALTIQWSINPVAAEILRRKERETGEWEEHMKVRVWYYEAVYPDIKLKR